MFKCCWWWDKNQTCKWWKILFILMTFLRPHTPEAFHICVWLTVCSWIKVSSPLRSWSPLRSSSVSCQVEWQPSSVFVFHSWDPKPSLHIRDNEKPACNLLPLPSRCLYHGDTKRIIHFTISQRKNSLLQLHCLTFSIILITLLPRRR